LVAAPLAEGDRKCEAQVADVPLIDLIERRETVGVVVAMVHKPIVRLGMAQALERHVCGGGHRCAGEESECECCCRARLGCLTHCRLHSFITRRASAAHPISSASGPSIPA